MVKKNFLKPEHRKLSQDEISELIEKLNIKRHDLPTIRTTDAAIKAFEPKVGDVFEIERESFAGKTKYWRVVEE